MPDHRIKQRTKRHLHTEIATRRIDPLFTSALQVLPNPDKVLRKLGRSYEIYEDMFGDAHILGELRAVRAALLAFEWQLVPGGDRAADRRAVELCEQLMAGRPAPGMHWTDTLWSMGLSVFYGFAVHEVVWDRQGDVLMPVKLIDRPQRRFVFDPNNQLRLKTRNAPVNGEALGAYKWLLTSHMASAENPYGIAVLSACFWPYVFKHGGFKFFSRFCEKYGSPWAIGKYPEGTPDEVQDKLLEQLAEMVETACAVTSKDSEVELLETKHSGQPVQERLIDLCNRELSKALTSQTLATEIQGTGSRAASETHRQREVTVHQSDRLCLEQTFNQLFAWITELNVAGARPPRFRFFEEAEARKDMAEYLLDAHKLIDMKQSEVYERLQLTAPQGEDAVIPRSRTSAGAAEDDTGSATAGQFSAPPDPAEAPCPSCGQGSDPHHSFAEDQPDPLVSQAVDAADAVMETLPAILYDRLIEFERQGKSLDEFEAALPALLPELDETALAQVIQLSLSTAYLSGMDEATDARR